MTDTTRHCPICGRWMDYVDMGGPVYECRVEHLHGPETPPPPRVTCRCYVCGKKLQGDGPRRCPACAKRARDKAVR